MASDVALRRPRIPWGADRLVFVFAGPSMGPDIAVGAGGAPVTPIV